jgi:PTS system mannose-specific IIB component
MEKKIFSGRTSKMISQIRVDDRLIHGQVAVVWTKELNAPLLVVANDEAANNPVMQMTLKMAVPNGMKLLIRGVDDAIKLFQDPRGKDKRIFVIVNCVRDANRIAQAVEDVETVNIANAGRFDKSDPKYKVMLFPSVQLNPDELETAKALADLERVNSYNQVLPNNPQLDLNAGLEKLTK